MKRDPKISEVLLILYSLIGSKVPSWSGPFTRPFNLLRSALCSDLFVTLILRSAPVFDSSVSGTKNLSSLKEFSPFRYITGSELLPKSDLTQSLTQVGRNISLSLLSWTRTIHPFTDTYLNGSYNIFWVVLYTSTGDSDRNYQSFCDISLPFGPPGCLSENYLRRLMFYAATGAVASSIAFWSSICVSDGTLLAGWGSGPITNIIGHNNSFPIVAFEEKDFIWRHSAAVLEYLCNEALSSNVWYLFLRTTNFSGLIY